MIRLSHAGLLRSSHSPMTPWQRRVGRGPGHGGRAGQEAGALIDVEALVLRQGLGQRNHGLHLAGQQRQPSGEAAGQLQRLQIGPALDGAVVPGQLGRRGERVELLDHRQEAAGEDGGKITAKERTVNGLCFSGVEVLVVHGRYRSCRRS
ncbi:MAG: hypothetical protein V9H69_13365 [Anaerolineae bacterium]